MLPFIENRLKRAALEVQEYVRLVMAAFHAVFTRPRYTYDIVAQFDAIGVGSLTVVILTGFFTGAAPSRRRTTRSTASRRNRSSGRSTT